MLERLAPKREALTVLQLSAVRNTHVERLLNRGVSPESIPSIRNRMRQVGAVFETAQVIDRVFRPSTNPEHKTPFLPSRFTDGRKGVFYSTLEEKTAIEEVRYHQMKSKEFADLSSMKDAPARYFSVYQSEFDGSVIDLFAIAEQLPELTSKDESGYPKCRQLAEDARNRSVNALRTPSARQQGGTCVPVFDRVALVDVPVFKGRGRFVNEDGEVVFRQLDSTR